MKRFFFIGLLGFFAIAIIGYFLWLVIRALHEIYSDWRLAKELDEIRAYAKERRQGREQEAGVLTEPTSDATDAAGESAEDVDA